MKHCSSIVNLRNCQNINNEIVDNLDLSSVEAIDLFNSNISVENLSQILKKAQNLKKLNLIGYKNFNDEIKDDLDLSSIEELDLSYSNISTENLGQILKKSRHLKKLIIEGCEDIETNINQVIEYLIDTRVTEVLIDRIDTLVESKLNDVLYKNKKLEYSRRMAVGEVLSRREGGNLNYNCVKRILNYMRYNPQDHVREDDNVYDKDARAVFDYMDECRTEENKNKNKNKNK